MAHNKTTRKISREKKIAKEHRPSDVIVAQGSYVRHCIAYVLQSNGILLKQCGVLELIFHGVCHSTNSSIWKPAPYCVHPSRCGREILEFNKAATEWDQSNQGRLTLAQ